MSKLKALLTGLVVTSCAAVVLAGCSQAPAPVAPPIQQPSAPAAGQPAPAVAPGQPTPVQQAPAPGQPVPVQPAQR